VAKIQLAPEVFEDFDRILEHLGRHQVPDAQQRIEDIIAAIDVLQSNPNIGRPAGGQNRELVVGERSHGYLALYRYYEEIGLIVIDAIRHQREVGYKRP